MGDDREPELGRPAEDCVALLVQAVEGLGRVWQEE